MCIDWSQPHYLISTELYRNAPWQQVSSGTRMVHQQRHMLSGKNKLDRDFQISKYHLISQRENCIMSNRIVLGNKPSSVAQHQNHAIVFIEMLE